jgi:hypothetical protein
MTILFDAHHPVKSARQFGRSILATLSAEGNVMSRTPRVFEEDPWTVRLTGQ